MNTRALRVGLLAVVVAVAVACGSSDDDASTSTTTPATGDITATVDWRARTADVDGLEGYDIDFCEGDAPILCVTRSGEFIGGIELASFPGGGAALDKGIDAWVEEHVRTLEADRKEGCDPQYELTEDDTTSAPFAGRNGYRYGLTGRIDGEPVERIVGVGVVDGDDLHLLVLNALADDGCLAREGELPLDAADDVAPALEALAAGSVALPSVADR